MRDRECNYTSLPPLYSSCPLVIRGVLMLGPAQTNLSSNAVGLGVISQLIDLLPEAADLSPVDAASSRSSDRHSRGGSTTVLAWSLSLSVV